MDPRRGPEISRRRRGEQDSTSALWVVRSAGGHGRAVAKAGAKWVEWDAGCNGRVRVVGPTGGDGWDEGQGRRLVGQAWPPGTRRSVADCIALQRKATGSCWAGVFSVQ